MNDGEASFREGMALLSDPGAAGRWREAITLIDRAAAAGEAEAIERRALFECMGIARHPDWNKALDSLTDAAERACLKAQQQLLLLADDRLETVSPIVNWRDVRSRIALGSRLKAPAGRTLSANPLIRTIAGFLTEGECAWLIAAAQPRLERAIIYNKETGEAGVHPGRTNQFALFNLLELDCIVEIIRTRIASALNAPLPCLEVSQVLRYAVGEEFSLHCDYLDPATMADEIAARGQRAATVLVYLNEDFAGGETSFPELRLEHRGARGDALLFSSVDPSGLPDRRTIHAGKPPTQGEKWLFSQWVRDRLPAAV
ncbi:MAG TPA: 2OG-Fe(II) oxygenase [Sphingomicrobium sp.]|nr:2OG-Fe(II) oxygenase [Sphingomicrobium sp.]